MDLASLWLPILLSSVIVFIASAVLHMIIPFHKGDFKGMPGEAGIMAEMRKAGLGRGVYMFPHCESMKSMGSPEYLEKYKQGPVGIVTILPVGPTPSMAKNLVQWFCYCIMISVFVAYLCRMLPAGAAYGEVFCWAATVGILGYGASHITESIWDGRPWGITIKFIIDGIIYGCLTGGTFGWLWPKAM